MTPRRYPADSAIDVAAVHHPARLTGGSTGMELLLWTLERQSSLILECKFLRLGIDRLMGYNQARGPRNDRSDPSRHEPAGMSARSGGPSRGTASVSTLPQFFRGVRLDPIETHHLRSLGIENSVYRCGSGSTPGKDG